MATTAPAPTVPVPPPAVRPDGIEKVTGTARYVADLARPGLLHAKLLLAGVPHARLRSIDTTAAKALPGVLAVLTQDDVPDVRYGAFVKDRTLFAQGTIRFEGEILAAVAAVSAEIAEQACALIVVDMEELPPVATPAAALAPGAALVHPAWESYSGGDVIRDGNTCAQMTSVKGDIEQGLAEADVVVRDRYVTDVTHATPIEPHVVLAEWQGGAVTVWSSTQAPFGARAGVARTLQLPESRVRIVVPTLGGGFGGKCDFHFEAHAAALSRAAGRPVLLQLSRREEFLCTDKVRHPITVELETGVRNDGTITARRARITLDGGAYVSDSLYAAELGLMTAIGPYRIPHIAAESVTVYTTRTPSGSVRAPGGPQVCWALEQHMDVIAERLGLDPVELRRRNLLQDGDTGPTGQVFHEPAALRCLETAVELAGWESGAPLPPGEALGVACSFWPSVPAPAGAYVKLEADGSGTIITGAQENGSGAVMALPLIAARELGLRPESFSLVHQDTGAGPWDLGSQGSQTTINNGRAVAAAAAQVREQLLDLASDLLDVAPSDLELADGVVRAKDAPSRSVTIAQLAAQATGGELLLGSGSGEVPALPEHDLSACSGRGFFAAFASPSFSCHISRVRVDAETGVARVIEHTAAHDFGFVMNPPGATAQVEGASIQGIGLALSEGTQLDERGQQRNPYLLDYKLQTSADAPRVTVALVEGSLAEGAPYGMKGVGEPPVVPPAAAVANAIARATGGRVHRLPMTPERIWAAAHGIDEEGGAA